MNENKTNKKRIVIIMSIIIVILAAGLCAYLFLAPKTIEGDWELTVNPETAQSTPDEADKGERDRVFYSFSKAGEYGDGTYKTYYDGGVEEGAYKLSEKNGKKLINLGTEDMEYTISGSKLFGGAKLTIVFPEQTDEQTGQTTGAQDYVFSQAKAPRYENESYDSFETDHALTSEWMTNERTLTYYVYTLSYTETVSFNDKGIMTIRYESADLMLDRTMYYAYTAKDGELTFSSVTDKDTKYTVDYSFDQNGNLIFTKDDTESSIFSDAFFGDVTYYTPDRLPASTLDES